MPTDPLKGLTVDEHLEPPIAHRPTISQPIGQFADHENLYGSRRRDHHLAVVDRDYFLPAQGGIGRLLVRFGVPGCHSRDYSEVDWMFLAGVSSYLSGELNFGVQQNPTGAERTGAIIVGETRWTVKQD